VKLEKPDRYKASNYTEGREMKDRDAVRSKWCDGGNQPYGYFIGFVAVPTVYAVVNRCWAPRNASVVCCLDLDRRASATVGLTKARRKPVHNSKISEPIYEA
jgi:hypothetical protein